VESVPVTSGLLVVILSREAFFGHEILSAMFRWGFENTSNATPLPALNSLE
jgi:hypothetical protein